MSIVSLPYVKNFRRQFAGPLDTSFVFNTTLDRQNYLNNNNIYEGLLSYDRQEDRYYYVRFYSSDPTHVSPSNKVSKSVDEFNLPVPTYWVAWEELLPDEMVTYTNLSPSTERIGGVKAGTIFNNEPIDDIFDKVFYPVPAAVITDCELASPILIGLPNVEVGLTLTSTITLNWLVQNVSSLKPGIDYTVTRKVIDTSVTTSTTVLTLPAAPSYSHSFSIGSSITPSVPTRVIFSVTAENIYDEPIQSNDYIITFNYPIFYGTHTTQSPSSGDILSMTKILPDLTNEFKIPSLTFSTGNYKIFAIPQSLGAVFLRDAYTNFIIPTNSFLLTLTINSLPIVYEIYYTSYIINGSIKVNIEKI